MEQLKTAQDLIKTRNGGIAGGFNSFIFGSGIPDLTDYDGRRGYELAQEMAENDGIAFTHVFRCECGGYPFSYGGFMVCNDCGRRSVDKEWWKIKVEKDGNAFCCHSLDFEPNHITEEGYNNYAFGNTFSEAIENYGKLKISKPDNKEDRKGVGQKE